MTELDEKIQQKLLTIEKIKNLALICQQQIKAWATNQVKILTAEEWDRTIAALDAAVEVKQEIIQEVVNKKSLAELAAIEHERLLRLEIAKAGDMIRKLDKDQLVGLIFSIYGLLAFQRQLQKNLEEEISRLKV